MSQRAPHDSMAPTLGGPSGPSRPPEADHTLQAQADEIPRRLGRFELASLLGEGGMGRVFAAYDPELRRDVAVKVLRVLNPATVGRFVREARTQASVFHPNICPVLEAGTVEGQPYIVMPRLDGESLDTAAQDLPLEGKLLLLRQVADAVHAAHQAGLIHRDLKPSNVLVEITNDGLVPKVLDFGLARPQSDPRFTRTGDVVGTPAYMSPEQVKGDAANLDRRTDVYSLGACLYGVLAGRKPFTGSEPSVFVQILNTEPEPLRPLGVPADVEAVVLKCLEKDPSRRYGSARELAEDLDRYLAGEPVRARATGRWYRFGKWASRNAALVRVAAVATLILALSLAWASWRADRRETVVRDLTRQVEEIDALARYSALSPLHDVRPDRDLIRERMAEISTTMAQAGSVGLAAGEYALGRGHLALGELEDARRLLESAWSRGLRDQDTASALARTLSGLYQQELAELELVRDWESRQRRRDDLEREYGDPARLYLDQSLGDEAAGSQDRQPDAYLLALAEFHNDRFAEALATLREVPGRLAWQHELDQLEGEILRTWAVEAAAADETDISRDRLAIARESFARAAETAPSDLVSYLGAARVEFQELGLDVSGSDGTEEVARGLEWVDRAISVDPDDGRAWLWKARLHRRAAVRLEEKEGDSRAELEIAAESGLRASELLSDSAPAWAEVGRAEWGLAQWRQDRGLDPGVMLNQAATSLDRVAGSETDYSHLIFAGMVERTRARYLADLGENERAGNGFQNAAEAYSVAAALHSEPFGASFNLGASLLDWAAIAPLEQRPALLLRAAESFEKARAARPAHFAPLLYLGRTLLLSARGGDPFAEDLSDADAAEAIALYRRAEELAPESFQVPTSLGEAFHLRAVSAWESGRDPTDSFAAARQEHERALVLAPQQSIPQVNLAWTAYFQGKFRVREGEDPGDFLNEAIRRGNRVLESRLDLPALLCVASADRLAAEFKLDRGTDPSAELAASEDALLRLISADPKSIEGHRSMGRLKTLEARWLRATGRDHQEATRQALDEVDLALEIHPGLARSWLAKAQIALFLAASGESDAAQWGLESADRALALREAWPRAREIRSQLLTLATEQSGQVSGSMTTSADRVPPP